MNELFKNSKLELKNKLPLAERIRPKTIKEMVGQSHLLGDNGTITKILANKKQLPSMILWGGAGCGKTSLARLITENIDDDIEFISLSAVFSGVGELRVVFNKAKERLSNGIRTVLFIDEIHRFNRAQQDAFLPVVENGTIILIGATTENPSFELNSALLSRCQVFVFNRLSNSELEQLLKRVEQEMERELLLNDDIITHLCDLADGDGRYFVNMIEMIYNSNIATISNVKQLSSIIQKRLPTYDKNKDNHYNLMSALHKSLRGSDCNGGLYWLARMLSGGEDALYIARRLVRFAYEDIGLADPNAAHQALMAWDCYKRLGSPEGEIALSQAVIYLATAPKSNSNYMAYNNAMAKAKETGSLMPPKHILNAPTSMMKNLGYGNGYKYDHNEADGFSGQNYFPTNMKREEFYQPIERGFERQIKKRLEFWENLRIKKKGED